MKSVQLMELQPVVNWIEDILIDCPDMLELIATLAWARVSLWMMRMMVYYYYDDDSYCYRI